MKLVKCMAAVALAACMSLFAAGCGSSGGSSAASAASASAASASASASSAAASATGVEMSSGAAVDGEYTVNVTLSGGSGKATVASPAKLVVSGGAMTATVVWSSSNYDLMVVDGTEYKPVTIDPASTFEIPVAALDQDLPVQAETTAMGTPHMIDYTLHFESGSAR